jgi:predicted NAD-dependent protein-ADP-ribosyltransferase YbiA (DUF1768 family)
MDSFLKQAARIRCRPSAAAARRLPVAAIVEHTTNDRFRGDDGDGSGKNWLGRILMDVREEFSSQRGG